MSEEKKCCCEHEKQVCNCEEHKPEKIDACECGLNGEHKEKEVCHCGEHKHEAKSSCGCGEHKHEEKSSCSCSEHKTSDSHSCCSSIATKHTSSCCSTSTSSGGACSCGCGGEKISTGNAKKDNIILIVKLAISLAFLVMGFFDWRKISHNAPWTIAFYYFNPAWITFFLCGIPLLISAVKSLLRKKITASVLISVAMLSAITLEIVGFFVDISQGGAHNHSYVFVAGEVAFLMAIGSAIEEITVKKSRAGIERLVGLIPKEAFVKVENGLEKRPLSQIKIGDIVVIKAGEQISVDGQIISGKASIDQSSVTGEYAPAELGVGDNVFGGTFNKSGVIEVRVTKLLEDMTISKMAKLVEEAENKKAPIARIADKWASVIVPTAILLAILVGIISAFAFKTTVVEAIIRTITVLIVFCPCSLGLATPTAIAAGLGNSAKNGVLVKSGESLEVISKCDIVCFDKTGTLTKGEIVVSDIATDDITEQDALKLAGSLELMSEHPLAGAVVEKAKGLTLDKVENVETMQGVGVKGVINGKVVQVVSYAESVKQNFANHNLKEKANEFLEQGKTVVSLVVDDKEVAVITFADTIREEAKQVVEQLNAMGKQTIMLTGDNEKSARFIAEKCGIKQVKFGLLPEQKLQEIEALQKEGHKVLMVGDGINDAPSLKLADCSVAMGALGSDIAIETADMAILNSDMNKIIYCVNHSKRTLFTIKRNIIMAMTINLISIILSMFGILTPMTGAIMHNVTSILVVLSSALLLINKKKKNK